MDIGAIPTADNLLIICQPFLDIVSICFNSSVKV